MSIEINCKDQKVDDIMRDVKEKSESVIYGGWHVVIGKSNDPIMEFTNLDNLNEDEQHELLGNLDVMITHIQLMLNNNFGVLPIFEAKIPTMRKLNVVKSLYNQVVEEIQKNMNNNETKSEDIKDKLVIIDCKDKDIVDILKHILNALYGEVSNSSPNIEFKNLDVFTIEDLKQFNRQLVGLYNTVGNVIGKTDVSETIYNRWRMARILNLHKQVKVEIQRKEDEVKKIEEEYFNKTNEELKEELISLNEWKIYYETRLREYRTSSRVHPIYIKNFEEELVEVNSRINIINEILAHRELEESKHIDEIRNEKWKRYNNLETEELEMILDALNVKCTLRKCELHKCEDNYESRSIKKAMDDILDNIKVIKDVLKYKRGE